MVDYTDVRNWVSDMITREGASITRTPITRTISGDYGDSIETAGTPASISAFVQAGVKSNKAVTTTGQVSDVDLKLIVKYDQTIGLYDKFTYQSDVYQIKVKEDLNEVYVQGYLVYIVVNLYRYS